MKRVLQKFDKSNMIGLLRTTREIALYVFVLGIFLSKEDIPSSLASITSCLIIIGIYLIDQVVINMTKEDENG